MFSNISNFAEGVDKAFVIILSLIFFFLIGLTAVLVYFIIRYREDKNPIPTQIEGNNKLEIIWTVIPLVLVLAMFYFGWVGFKPMISKAPDDALQIKTTARMWSWMFEYPNGKRTDTLYVPAGEPVNLTLNSLDVIHSLYIPAFRIKNDVVPGSPHKTWFIANSPGSYDLFCTEYCGLQHSYMYTSVEVMPADKFEKWLGDTIAKAPGGAKAVHPGKLLTQQFGCNACHSTDGTKIVGPSYLGLFGKEETVIRDGEEVTLTVDEEYVKRSIYDPNFDVVKGFNKGLMLSYKDQITEEELGQIIDYLKTLN